MIKTNRKSQKVISQEKDIKPSEIKVVETSQEIVQVTNDDSLKARELAYYTTVLQSWVSTRMEQDKTIITLSTGGIGLCVTILTATGIKDKTLVWLFALAIFSFLGSIISSLLVFHLTAKLLSEEIKILNQNKNETPDEKWLRYSEKAMLLSFVIGIIFFLTIGLQSSCSRIQ